ncbi:MAG TPA: helix-turn-helix transcriptional regulator [Shinella sp.]|jgi:transcriptional regulator with XRE-family HTH domain|uniref:helix-turn-helix domain-containing protein n=1 Tax=Shinella TaxID=323620 RepID=UPI0007DA66BE|nr:MULTISPECIES: helix-turn-helix transcriptional regulator [Shinella]CAI0341761.1 Uncharacterized HTH-type transcriptional regulator Smed_0045 [Rhizobiaceae bacterium]CAK7262227.1 Uncharacterized HTH-type transcriptional regulator R00410 [Shinella sp. WSC3-e]ANH09034.1 transcriptional regulator [Shinella sp. HZN7]MDC7260358.1 helix-turn-helix domain-containing protein [Shinella sp. YE25]HEV7251381.1 helix-turn-helix transcriptional regulator [Shinella sp.]
MKKTADIKAPNAIDIEVGRRIRQRRQMLGFSQSILAENLGVTFQQVQKYEKGTNRVGSSRLQNIARFLTCPVAYFFEGTDQIAREDGNVEGSNVTDFVMSSEGLQLNRAFLSISNGKVRRRFVALVKTLANDQDAADASDALDP